MSTRPCTSGHRFLLIFGEPVKVATPKNPRIGRLQGKELEDPLLEAARVQQSATPRTTEERFELTIEPA